MAILLALLLLALVSYKLSPWLQPPTDVTVEPRPACDPGRTACTVSLPDGGQMRLSFAPLPVPLAKPFDAHVSIEGARAKNVLIDFSGVSMNMGLNRPQLTGNGADFAASVTLPVCVTGRMEWQATVIAEIAHRRIAVPFRFTTG